MENNKIRVTVSLFFKATGSKMGGGETLYCASKIDLNAENLIEFDLREYAQSQVDGAWFDENGYVYDVIAWRPLPESYRPERSVH